MGPYKSPYKKLGTHRDYLIPKLGNRMEVYAKKLRELYLSEVTIPD